MHFSRHSAWFGLFVPLNFLGDGNSFCYWEGCSVLVLGKLFLFLCAVLTDCQELPHWSVSSTVDKLFYQSLICVLLTVGGGEVPSKVCLHVFCYGQV